MPVLILIVVVYMLLGKAGIVALVGGFLAWRFMD